MSKHAGVALAVHGTLGEMDRDPDLVLLEAWRGGDKKAGNELFKRHFGALRRFFANKVTPHELEDLMQQTMLGCVTGNESFRGDARFKTYLFAIARKKLLYHYRTWHNRDGRTDSLDLDTVTVRDVVGGPSSIIVRNRKQRLIIEALRAIPVNDQIILELYYWENMTAPAISETYEMGVPAVRGRLRRAKDAFKTALAALTHGEDDFTATFSAFDAGSWVEEIRNRFDELKPVRKKRQQA